MAKGKETESTKKAVAGPSEGHPLQDLRDDFGRALDRFYRTIGLHHHGISGHVAGAHEPPADVSTSATELTVSMELPGMTANQIEILASEGRLTIRGEKATKKVEEGVDYIRRERLLGRFHRSFHLPDSLDSAKTTATFKNGVLTVSIPEKPGAQRKAKKVKIAQE